MFEIIKKRPKFSFWAMFAFAAVMVAAGIYIVFMMGAAKPHPGSSKNLEILTQEVLGEARDIKHAKGEQKAELAKKIKGTANERKQVALSVIENDPESFLRVAIPKKLKTETLIEVAEDVEEETIIEGTVEMFEYDDFDKGIAKKEHHLKTGDNKSYKLKFAQKEPAVKSGDRVKVKGYQIESLMAVDGSVEENIQIVQPSSITASTTTVKKVAALLFTFTDNTLQYYSKEIINGQLFTNSNSVKNYFKEVSYGKIDLQGKVNPGGDIYGWFQLPIPAGTTCDYQKYRDTALSEAQRLYGFSKEGYDNIILIFPKAAPCTFGGLATSPGSGLPGYSWINQQSGKTVMHEMGHNYGVGEGSAWNCTQNGTRVTISDTCSFLTYGNPFSVMGTGTSWYGHYVAVGKERAGYFGPGNVVTVTASGNYDLYQLSKNTGTTALRIPVEKDSFGRQLYYYVETRRTFGFDAIPATNTVQQGVLVVHGFGGETDTTTNRLLDMTPETTSYFDAALTLGKTFIDNGRGVTIKVISADALKTTVNITVPTAVVPCVKGNPLLTVSPIGQYGTSGQALTYQVTLKNNDSSTCQTTAFGITATVPSGFVNSPISLIESLAPGDSVTKTITITSPATAVNGAYPFTITAKNSTATAYAASVTANYNVYNPVIIPEPTNPVQTPPIVTLSGISTGQVVTTNKINVRVTASDSSGIASIKIYLDERLVSGCSLVSNCSYQINPRKLLTGSHVLKAVVIDKENQTNSTSISFTKK